MKFPINDTQARKDLKEYIIKSGCYSREENERIYNKWFASAPRYIFRAVNKKYHLTEKILCDVGCAYGMNLIFCNSDSFGIECKDYETRFAFSIGLNIYKRDVLQENIADIPKADAIWNSAVLEHVDSPHTFLRKLYNILKPDGLLAMYVPTIPIIATFAHLPVLGKYFKGHKHGDHINAFTPKTLRFFCERAGFETIEVSAFYPGLLSFMNKIILIDGCVYVGRKNDNWEYHQHSTRRKADNEKGFISLD